MTPELPPARLSEEHLSRARDALAAGDETATVVWSNLCAEVAVAYLAGRHGIDLRRNHFRRASAARRLFERGVLSEDLTDLLIRLNNERKHAIHEGRKPDLRGRTWPQVFDCLEQLVSAVRAMSLDDAAEVDA